VGFLFIPWFNLYWIFRMCIAFPVEYNGYRGRQGATSVPMPKYALLDCALLLTGIPVLVGVLLLVGATSVSSEGLELAVNVGGVISSVLGMWFLTYKLANAVNDLALGSARNP